MPDRQVAYAVRYIAEHYQDAIHTADVARQAGVARRSLQDRFIRHIERTIHDQILNKRIESAKQLLRTTDLKTAAIASESGFGSRERFSKAFKQFTKLSPVAYRQAQAKLGRKPR